MGAECGELWRGFADGTGTECRLRAGHSGAHGPKAGWVWVEDRDVFDEFVRMVAPVDVDAVAPARPIDTASVHFVDDVGDPAAVCGVGACWLTPLPDEVTCPGCVEWLEATEMGR